MKIKFRTLFIALFALISVAFAQRAGGVCSVVEGGRQFMESLNLTPQQREAFVKLGREIRTRDSASFAILNKLRSELFYESSKTQVDTTEIKRIASSISSEHHTLSISMYYNIRKIKDILTQEQFERFMEFRKSRPLRNVIQGTE